MHLYAPFYEQKRNHEKVTLEKQIFKYKSGTDRKAYNKQCNYVVSLLRNEKKDFCSNLDTKVVIDNRTFLKTAKPFLCEKVIKYS